MVLVQYGQQREIDSLRARTALGSLLGPIPRYLYPLLDEAELAQQIERRWIARRMEMSSRIVLDQRLLRYMDPEKVQDHWQNFWTGKPHPKLQHSDRLAVGVYNMARPIVEAMTALLVGSKPMPYQLDVMPWDRNSAAAAAQAEIVEQFTQRWQAKHDYELVLNDRGGNMFALGRNWNMVTTPPGEGMLPRPQNVPASAVASFWQSDQRTLECVIVGSEMLPGEAVALYPDKEKEISQAVHSPAAWFRYLGAQRPWTTWDLNSTVSILTSWYRSSKGTLGQAAVLMNAPLRSAQGRGNSVLLAHKPDTQYPDIPLFCVPRWRTNDRPPDEAQGVLFDIAPVITTYDEMVSAGQDMLKRAIYQRYKLTNAYGKPPTLIPNTSIIALRAGQDLNRLDDVLNSVPVDTFIARLEDFTRLSPGLSDYFIGRVPPAETSGEAITRAINASIQRLEVTRTEFAVGERWTWRQVVAQAATFYHALYKDEIVRLDEVLRGDYEFHITFTDQNPADAVKAKQLALAALRAGVISLDTAQKSYGIVSTIDEQKKIRRERMDPVMRPDIVQLTAGARAAMLNQRLAEQAAAAPPQPQTPPVRVSISGQLDPARSAMLAEEAMKVDLVPGGPVGPPADQAGKATEAADRMRGDMKPARFENDNQAVEPDDLEGAAR